MASQEHPSLPTKAPGLEEPQSEPPQKGLVPRSSVFIIAFLFCLILVVFFVIDVVKSNSPPPAHTDAAPEKKVEVALGPAPQATDIISRAETQLSKAETEIKAPAMPVTPFGSLTTTSSNSPVPVNIAGQPASSYSGETSAPMVSAADERRSQAREAEIFAIEPKMGPSALVASASTDGVAEVLNQLRNASSRSAIPGAPGSPESELNETIRAAMTQQGQAQGGVRDLDPNAAFARQVGESSSAPAVRAQPPASRNMVFQGTRIPLVTREAINSDLPGQLTAVSTDPIYDGIDQCRLLIPAGTRFIGQYNSQVKPGQVRVMMAFQRMILPDGRSVDLGGAGGADSIGAAGLGGDVDNHFLKIFGYSFAVALLADKAGGNASYTTTQPNGTTSTTTIAGQVLAQSAGAMMSRNINIAPTISAPPGVKLFVTIVRDITLDPVRNTCR